MKSYLSLSLREIRAQKVTSVLIFIAVLLSALMTAAVGQSLGMLRAMRTQQAAQLNGNRYVTFHQLSRRQADAIGADERLSYAQRMITLGTADLPQSSLSVLVREYEGDALGAYPAISQLEEGALPTAAGEIALPRDVLELLGFSGTTGDFIELPLSISLLQDTQAPYTYTARFKLTGILKSNYVGYVTSATSGIAGPGSAQLFLPLRYQLYSLDIRTALAGRFQAIVDDLAEKNDIPEHCIQYNDLLLGALGISYRAFEKAENEGAGFSYLTAAGVLTAGLVLAAAGLVIYNVLKIAVAKRVGQYGVLRALGAQQKQVYKLVAAEQAALCALGLPLGTGLGVLCSRALTGAAVHFFSPEALMASSRAELAAGVAESARVQPWPLAAATAVTLLFAIAAAWPAARYAARVPPTVAMAGSVQRVRRRIRKPQRIRSFAAYYARLNMKRSPGRTAITVCSLVMAIMVFVALQSFAGLLDASRNVQSMHLGDYCATAPAAGFSARQVAALRENEAVASLSTLKASIYVPDDAGIPLATDLSLQPGETLHIVGVDETRLKRAAPGLRAEDLVLLREGKACLAVNPIAITQENVTLPATHLAPQEKVTVNGISLKVLANTDAITQEGAGFLNGVQIVVYDTVYDRLTGSSAYTELYPSLGKAADRSAFEATLDSLCANGGYWLSYAQTDRQLKESYAQIRFLCWCLIALVSGIGVLNIINTVYTNIHTRVREIGVQRALGMSVGALYKTFLWEGAYYGMLASALGAAGGYLCTVVVNAAVTEQLQWAVFPAAAIGQAAAAAVAACMAASCIPLRRVAQLDIVPAVEAAE